MSDTKSKVIQAFIADQKEDDHYSWVCKIPEPLKDGLVRYRNEGIETGHFLMAVLENDLQEAVVKADMRSLRSLRQLIWWLRRFMPADAWGDPIKVSLWIHKGGLLGCTDKEITQFFRARSANLQALGIQDEITGI